MEHGGVVEWGGAGTSGVGKMIINTTSDMGWGSINEAGDARG
jgi:hypothetical protein